MAFTIGVTDDNGVFIPKAAFRGAPACGCTWTLQALVEAGVPRSNEKLLVLERKASTRVHQLKVDYDVPIISTVRPVDDWLRSYFDKVKPNGSVQRLTGNPNVDVFQSLDWSSLDAFVGSYLEKLPGHISRMFKSYHDKAKYILNLGSIASDMSDALSHCGVPFRVALLMEVPPQGVSSKTVLSDELRKAIREAEDVDDLGYPSHV